MQIHDILTLKAYAASHSQEFLSITDADYKVWGYHCAACVLKSDYYAGLLLGRGYALEFIKGDHACTLCGHED